MKYSLFFVIVIISYVKADSPCTAQGGLFPHAKEVEKYLSKPILKLLWKEQYFHAWKSAVESALDFNLSVQTRTNKVEEHLVEVKNLNELASYLVNLFAETRSHLLDEHFPGHEMEGTAFIRQVGLLFVSEEYVNGDKTKKNELIKEVITKICNQ